MMISSRSYKAIFCLKYKDLEILFRSIFKATFVQVHFRPIQGLIYQKPFLSQFPIDFIGVVFNLLDL